GHFVVEKVVVAASESLDEVQLFGMRRSRSVHPETFIEADIIDNQCVAFPMSSRVAVVTGNQILRMGRSVRINDSECVWTADIEDENLLLVRHLDDLCTIWCHELTGATGWFAARVRFKFITPAVVQQRLRPWLKRSLGVRQTAAARTPNTLLFGRRAEAYMTI